MKGSYSIAMQHVRFSLVMEKIILEDKISASIFSPAFVIFDTFMLHKYCKRREYLKVKSEKDSMEMPKLYVQKHFLFPDQQNILMYSSYRK